MVLLPGELGAVIKGVIKKTSKALYEAIKGENAK
jgi:hypothetical protein